jgi:vancomycin permeability regulator SanA
MTATEILIILGSPNSPEGKLLQIALDRLDYCLSIFDQEKNLILCTGGFGKHFNTTEIPHARYAVEYLMEHGIHKDYFLKIALSSNTVDDALKTKEILSDHKIPVKIITSDYHLERVKVIFEQILANLTKTYVGVSHNLPEEVRKQLASHEKKAMDNLIRNGIYF